MTPELSFALLGQWMFFGVVQQFHFMLKTLVHRYISSSISEILNWPPEKNDTFVPYSNLDYDNNRTS